MRVQKHDASDRHILFVTKDDMCRGPMFVEFCRVAMQEEGVTGIRIESASILRFSRGESAKREAREAMKECGLSIETHRARWIGELHLEDYDDIICLNTCIHSEISVLGLSNHVKLYVLTGNPEGIPNPDGGDQKAYNACAMTCREAARSILGSLRSQTKRGENLQNR